MERDLSPVEQSRIEIFRRVIFLRLKSTPDGVGSPGPPTPVVGAPPCIPPTGSPGPAYPTRKLKLSSVIDPTLDFQIMQLEQTTVADMFSRYRAKFRDLPLADIEPTSDQLSGISQLLKSGALPYVDMSIDADRSDSDRSDSDAAFFPVTFWMRQMESGRKRKHPAQPTYNSGRSRSKPTRCHCCCWKPQMLKDTKDNMAYIKTSMASSGRRHAWGIIYRAEVSSDEK